MTAADDGWSGGTFERPSWKRLLEDIEAGKVGIVLAKDMSRIGRDYLQTGFYTEVLFREKDVRFIAISNGVDSADSTTSEFAPFLNIMNEWYLKDCSRKQKSAYQARSKAGKPVTNHAIYGYLKDPEDKHHWIVDPEAAAVVKRIFQMCMEGRGPSQIANQLTAEKHTIRFMYTDGSVDTGFEIISGTPTTGDTNNVLIWIIIAIAAVVVIAVIIMILIGRRRSGRR